MYRNNRDKQLSKTLSWLLRHGAIKEGLKISPEGYLSVEDILQHKSCRGKYSVSDVIRVVSTNDKQRFQLRHSPDSVLEIKAHQGHTIQQVNDSGLTPILQSKYKTVVHGTYSKCWPYIKDKGLSCMKRKHIHLAKGTLDDPNIISGIRRDVQIYIFIDVAKALADGIKFYESDNGVILTPGNAEGYLEPKYFEKVIQVNTGYPEYTQPQDITRIFANYGTVKVDRINSKFAILTFADEDDAQEAVEDSLKVNIYGEFLTVTPYSPGEEDKDDKGPPTPKRGTSKPETSKRVLIGSRYKGEIIEPKLICLEGDFHQQLDNILCAVRLTQEEVTTLSGLYQDLEWVLQQQWPGCIACPFGSITTGLGIKSSDADCFIQVPVEYRQPGANFVNKAKRLLQQYPRVFAEVLSIPRANTPIVKFFHVPTRTYCDVTFKTPLGARNSKLIAFLLHADPRLIPMAVVIKYWAKVHDFSGTGKLTNYALTMLIIFYLQQPPHAVLPSVEWLQRDRSNDFIVDDWNTGFMHCHDLLPRTSTTATIAELIGGFFEFYSKFDFDESVVCPFTGHAMKKNLFKDHNSLPPEFERYKRNIQEQSALPLRVNTCIVVQDPIEQSHNVASAICRRLAVDIKEYFKFAAHAYSTEKRKHCAGFLPTILLQKPKLPKRGTSEFRIVIFPHILECIRNADWKAVVREVMMQMFEDICKIPLTKVDEKPNEGAKRQKEKYTGIVTKAIWKRKQFNKLYSFSRLSFLKKQKQITEEIMNVEKETFKVKFQLTLSFSSEVRNLIANVKLVDGDMVMFREFGRFFITSLQSWYMNLLKPYCNLQKSHEKCAVPNGSKAENISRLVDEDEENSVDIKCTELLQSHDTSSELADVSLDESLVNDINDICLDDSTRLSNDTE